jgi:hypothetical protein
MPAKNPRLTITLKPELAAQLRRLSQLTGSSQSSMIGEMLEGSGAVFDRMIQVLEAAETAKEAMKGKFAQDIGHAQTKMEKGLGIVVEGFDQFTESLLDEAQAVTRRGRASGAPHAPGAAAPTPISNRGVRSLTTARKNIAQGQGAAKAKAGNDGTNFRGGKK